MAAVTVVYRCRPQLVILVDVVIAIVVRVAVSVIIVRRGESKLVRGTMSKTAGHEP